MAEDKISQTDLALISFARFVLGALFSADLIRPNQIYPALKDHQDIMAKAGYTIAGGILGSIRQFSNDPDRERSLEELRRLIRAQPQGTA